MTSERDELEMLLREFTDAQVRQLLNVATAMDSPMSTWVAPTSRVATLAYMDEVTARLQAHHGTHWKSMDRIAFEDAHVAGTRADGHRVLRAESATTSYYDVVVDGEKVALKSTAARDVRPGWLHISKLCEAAWIQDCRNQTHRYQGAMEAMRLYVDSVDRIFQLRVLPHATQWLYELVEIPMALFHPIFRLRPHAFSTDAPRVAVEDSLGKALTLVLDRSDAKITITRILKERCIVHATWSLAKRVEDIADE